jgi:hypothetical protein
MLSYSRWQKAVSTKQKAGISKKRKAWRNLVKEMDDSEIEMSNRQKALGLI